MTSSVLIVDDSSVMRKMIKRTIAIAGLDIDAVYEAANGIEAFAQLAKHDIGLVILDINMPVMNGMQFLSRVHDDPRLRDVPVVIASTEGSETRIEELMENGARGYLRKPFHPEQLRDKLAPFLGLRGQQGAGVSASDFADEASF